MKNLFIILACLFCFSNTFSKDNDTIKKINVNPIIPIVKSSSAINIETTVFVDYKKSHDKALEKMSKNGFKVWKLYKGIFKGDCFVYKWSSNTGKVTISSINKDKVRIDFTSFDSNILMKGVDGDLLAYRWFYEPSGKFRYSNNRSKKYSAILDFVNKTLIIYKNNNNSLTEMKDERYSFKNCE